MHKSTQQSGSASADESFSSTSSSTSDDDGDLTPDPAFMSRLPRFEHKAVAKLVTVQPGCRDLVRPGRNCHTYSKRAGFSLSNDGDSSVGSAAKSRSWKHVSRNVDVATLSRLLDSSETEVLFALVLMGHNLDALLENAALDCAALNMVLALLVKACMCRQAEHLRLLLGMVAANDRFLRNVEQQLVCRRRLPVFWDQFVVPLVTVVEKAVQLLPRGLKTNLCGVAAALLDLVNNSLQDTQPVDADIVEVVESIGTHLAEANKPDTHRVVSRGRDASFPGDGDGEEKSFSALPAEFIQTANLTEAAELDSAPTSTTADYLSLQYSRLRELFLAPLRRILTTLQSYPAPADTSSVVIYTRVKIGPPICTFNGVGHKVNFSVVDSRGCESRLLPGSMVCVSNDGFQTIFLGTVIWRSFKDRQRGHMVASFLEHRRLEALAPARGFVMTECPQFYDDYASVFAVMREFETEQLQMPFRKYIIEGRCHPMSPGYMNNNTVFDMKALFQKSVFIRPQRDRDWPGSEESVLDRYQYDAVQTAVSKAVTLVEGIPGTGKTFMTTRLISVMLDNRDVFHGGPVLVVSKDAESLSSFMTQFDGVLDDVEVVTAESDLFQIGRNLLSSDPKNKTVEPTALRLLRRHVDELEYLKARARSEQDNLRRTPSRLLGESELKSVMSETHYKSLFFTLFTGAEDKLRDWLLADNEDVASRFSSEQHSSLSDEEVCYISDVWALDMESRYRLYEYWRDAYYDRKSQEWTNLVERFKVLLSLKKEVEEKLQLEALSTAKIVGTTIASLQKVWRSLRDIRPQVIIVQEGRSIPEPFMFSVIALNPYHIVLVSDTRNIFDVLENSDSQSSLFDRLVEQGVACCQLLGQYQLNPQTVRILEAFKTKKLFERYEFHKEHSKVRGVSLGVRFVDHCLCYDKDVIIACAVEAEFVASLARYLLLQGYRAYQITVYAPTTDQVELIKSNMCGLEEEPLVTTFDKAKGCKNEIVLMSFSCPNTTYDIELSSRNHYQAIASSMLGLYCVGNMTYLEEHSRTWKQVAPVLHSEGLVGPLELTCQVHPGKKTTVSTAKDFAAMLDGGCSTPCDAHLPCGHPCPKTCHLTDRDHQEIACTKPCKKLLPCDHPCKALCGEPCLAQCGVMVNALSPCDHVVRVPCSAVLNAHEVRSQCTEMCGKKICRGVRCERTCRDCFLEGTHLSDDVYFEEEPSTCSSCRVM